MARGKLAELFYDLRANTEGLGNDLKDAEGQFGKLSKYVMAHPYQSIGALAAAVSGVGVVAVKMAAEVDKSLRQVEARVPGTTAQMARLRDTIEEMSTSGPHSQATLAAAAAEISRQGVGTIEEVQQRLAAVTKVADATGEDVMGIVAGLDQAMDMFGIASKDSEAFLAKLYATAANKMPITDLFTAFQTAAPAVREFGLDADITMRALGALLEKGMSAKQAGSELKAYGAAGAEGAAEIRKLADSYDVAADASARMDAAQQKMNGSVEAVSAQIKNKLNAELIELGQTILPLVEQAANGVVIVLDTLLGKVGKIYANSELRTLLTGFSTSGQGKSAADVKREMVRLDEAARGRKLDLGGFSVAELDRMLGTIRAVAAETKTSEAYFGTLKKAIAAAREEAVKLESASGATPGAKKTGPKVRTAAEIKKDQDAAAAALKARDKELEQMGAALEREVTRVFAEIEAHARNIAAVQEDLAQELVKATKTQLDDIAQYWDAKIARALKSNQHGELDAEIAKYRALKAEAIATRKVIEETDEVARDLGLTFGDIANAAAGGTTEIDKSAEALARQALLIQQSVDGALQLAEAFGMVHGSVVDTLRGVAQIAGNIPNLLNTVRDARSGAVGPNGTVGIGALIGAGLPVAGAVASIVGGLLSSAKAAREHAKALAESRRKLTESLQERVARSGLNDQQQIERDAANQRRDDLNAILDLLVKSTGVRIGTRDQFFAKDEGGQRKVLTDALAQEKAKFPAGFESSLMRALEDAIKQFDLVAAAARKAADDMAAELAEKRKDIDQSLAERRLRVADRTDEADALAFKRAQEKELADAEAGGVYTLEQLTELRAILNDEEKKYLADAQKRREDEDRAKAQTAARRTEDLQTRINAADGESPQERARAREIEKRRELEDAMAEGADAATLALIQLAQAADDAAAAARAAMEAQREVEDLDVELLQLQGKMAEAEARAAELALQRRWDDAVAAGKDPAVLAKLAEVIAAKRAELAAQAAGGGAAAVSATDAAAAASGEGATSAAGTGIGTATIVQVDRMLGLMGTFVAYQREELDLMKDFVAAALVVRPPLLPPALPSSFTVGQGGQLIQIRVQLTMHFNGPVAGGAAGGAALGQATLDAIDTGLANNSMLSALGRGDVSR